MYRNNYLLSTFKMVFFGVVLIAQTSLISQNDCHVRTFNETCQNEHGIVRIDSICNGKIIWSEINKLIGYEFQRNEYDLKDRITQKVIMKCHSKRKTKGPGGTSAAGLRMYYAKEENYPKYKEYHTDAYFVTSIDTISYQYIPEKTNTQNTDTKKFDYRIENIVFRILIEKVDPFDLRKVNFYYRYEDAVLIIHKEELDQFGSIKEIDQDENTYSVVLDKNILTIKSMKYPIEPNKEKIFGGHFISDISAGDIQGGLYCEVYLNEKVEILEIDEFWLGKTILEYENGKLSQIQEFKCDELYCSKLVTFK